MFVVPLSKVGASALNGGTKWGKYIATQLHHPHLLHPYQFQGPNRHFLHPHLEPRTRPLDRAPPQLLIIAPAPAPNFFFFFFLLKSLTDTVRYLHIKAPSGGDSLLDGEIDIRNTFSFPLGIEPPGDRDTTWWRKWAGLVQCWTYFFQFFFFYYVFKYDIPHPRARQRHKSISRALASRRTPRSRPEYLKIGGLDACTLVLPGEMDT